jgi:hypothetical protein
MDGDSCEQQTTEMKRGLFRTISTKTETNNSITVQVPQLVSFRVNLSGMVIPKGMSLLAALPGANGVDDSDIFMLVTAYAVYPDRNPERSETAKPELYHYTPAAE